MKVEILLKIPHKGKRHTKSARCQDRTDDLRIMDLRAPDCANLAFDIIVSLRKYMGLQISTGLCGKKNFLSQKILCASVKNNDSCRTSRSSIGRALDCRILGYRAVAGSIPAERIFFVFVFQIIFCKTDDCLKTKNGENYSSRIPSGYGGGLEIHWALPAQVQVLPTAIHFLFTNFRAFSSFLCSF